MISSGITWLKAIWNSVEHMTWWSTVFLWLLVALGGCTTLATILSALATFRKDALKEVQDQRTARQSAERIAEANQRAAEANRIAQGHEVSISQANARANLASQQAAEASERANKYASEIAKANAEAAVARKESAEANQQAKKYESSIATANARSAEAEKRAAEANLELARLRTPRTLNEEQQKRISSRMKPYAGQKFSIIVASDPEAISLANTIRALLTDAGWLFDKDETSGLFLVNDYGVGIADGLSVQVAEKRDPGTEARALALGNALIDEGMSIKGQVNGSPNSVTTKVYIVVGKKL